MSETYSSQAADSSALDRPFHFTRFTSESAQRKIEKHVSLRTLAKMIERATAPTKAALPWTKFARFGDVRTPLRPHPTEPRMTGNSLRHDANVIAATGVEADYDGEIVQPEEAVGLCKAAGLTVLIHDSAHWSPDAPRFRIFAPFSKEHPPETRAGFLARLNGVLGGVLAPESFRVSQAYYGGAVEGRPKIRTFLVEGTRYLDEADDLDAGAIGTPKRDRGERHDAEAWGRPLHVLRSALMAIPNDGSHPDHADRDWWLKIGMALHFEGAPFDLFDEWSAQWPGYLAEPTLAAWESFGRDRGRMVTGHHILNLAEAHGWRDLERMLGLFDDLADEAAMEADIDELVGQPGGGFFESAASWTGTPPPRDWLVEELVPNKTVTMLGGDGGTGKSLLAMQLATAVAARTHWIGRPVARPGVALYLSAEDDRDELRRRVAAIARAEGLEAQSLSNLLVRSMADEEPLLAVLDPRKGLLQATALYQTLARAMEAAKPSLLVLDTLADLHTGNESDRAQARQFIGLMRRLAIKHDCAVLLLAHPSLTGMASGSGLSGSTGWSNSVRSRLYFDRVKDSDGSEPDPDARVLRTVKANYGPIGGEIALQWRDGVFAASEVFSDDESPLERARRVFLRLLDLFADQGRHVSPSPSSTYAPKVFSAHPERDGCTKAMLERAMETLLGDRTITTGEHGFGQSKRAHLVRGNRG